MLRCHRYLELGSDRIENQDIGARRCFHLSVYPPPDTPLSNRRRYVLRAWGRELFTLYSDVSPTINDRSIDESIKRECVRGRICMNCTRDREKKRRKRRRKSSKRTYETRHVIIAAYRQRYYTGWSESSAGLSLSPRFNVDGFADAYKSAVSCFIRFAIREMQFDCTSFVIGWGARTYEDFQDLFMIEY